MTFSILLLVIAVVLFVIAAIPGVSRGWMIAAGLAFFAASFLPYFSMHVGR